MNFRTGTIEGTGASLTVEIGFIPKWIRFVNADGDAELEWFNDMTDAHGYKMNGGSNGEVSTLGVTPSDPDDSFLGVTLGADTDVNVNGETLYWVALG